MDAQSNTEPNPKTTEGKGRLRSWTFWIELCMEDRQNAHPCHMQTILKLVSLLTEGEFRLNHVKAHTYCAETAQERSHLKVHL